MEEALIPIAVVVSRHTPGWEQAHGESIDWQVGERAVMVGDTGIQRRVVIASGRVAHREAPGVACYEVTFTDEGGALRCVPARVLRHPLWASAVATF